MILNAICCFQDDHPPLPDGISAALSDFLLHCFKKEPAMRKGIHTHIILVAVCIHVAARTLQDTSHSTLGAASRA
jgi:hypothetical protein